METALSISASWSPGGEPLPELACVVPAVWLGMHEIDTALSAGSAGQAMIRWAPICDFNAAL